METRQRLERQLQKLNKLQEHIKQKLRDIQANKRFKCLCGKMHAIKSCVAKRYSVRPIGSDDDWSYSDIYVVCPTNAEVENRLLFHSSNDIPYDERQKYENNIHVQFEREYWGLFKERLLLKEEHKYIPNNNEYIAENFKKFGLKIEYIEKMKQKYKSL